jgi:molybdopterin-guanine dinucleotide biosynthesis protein A
MGPQQSSPAWLRFSRWSSQAIPWQAEGLDSSAVSLIVLAGGRGSRLGGARKAWLEVGGRPIVQRVLEALGPLAAERLLLMDRPEPTVQGARVLVDAEAHAGVLPALAHGLSQASGEACLIVAADMPFVSRAVFDSLLGQLAGVDVVVPRVEGVLQPMHAVVRRVPTLEAVRQGLASGEKRWFRVLETLARREVTQPELRALDPELMTLFNVNTPEDLAAARTRAATGLGADLS